MQANYYMKKLYQDMQLRGYTEHTQEVYGRVVGNSNNRWRRSDALMRSPPSGCSQKVIVHDNVARPVPR